MQGRITDLLLQQAQYDALNLAHTPFSGNPYATVSDLTGKLVNPISDYPVYVVQGDYDNGLSIPSSGYTTLEAAFSGYTNFRRGGYLYGVRTTYINQHFLTVYSGFTGGDYIKGDNSAIILEPGVVIRLGRNNTPCYLEGLYITFSYNGATTGLVSISGNSSPTQESISNTLIKSCTIDANFIMNNSIILLDTYITNIQGSGILYLYGTSSYDRIDPNIRIVDRRPSVVTQIKPYPSTGSTSTNNLDIATLYYRDGNIGRFTGVNTSNQLDFDITDTVNWSLVAGGLTKTERSYVKSYISPFQGVSGITLGDRYSQYIGYTDLIAAVSSGCHTVNMLGNGDVGYVSFTSAMGLQVLNGNNGVVSVGASIGNFSSPKMTIKDITIGDFPLSANSASFMDNGSNTNRTSILYFNNGDITNPTKCHQLINSSLTIRTVLSNAALTLRDSYVQEIASPSSGSNFSKPTNLFLYGTSRFGVINLQSGYPPTIYDYRPYRNTMRSDASNLKFDVDSFYRVDVTGNITLSTDLTGAVSFNQVRLTTSVNVTSFTNIVGQNVRTTGSFVSGVENVFYITYVEEPGVYNSIFVHISQKPVGVGI